MTPHLCLAITQSSHGAQARRLALQVAQGLGFDETGRGKVALVVTEVATNLIKHATHGQLLVQGVTRGDGNWLEILGLDKGHGMTSVVACMRDGYSTAGSPGTGLGAIIRNSSLAEIYSVPHGGTAMLARLQPRAQDSRLKVQGCALGSLGSQIPDSELRTLVPNSVLGSLDVGAVCVPKPGEEVCGDAWAVDQRAGRCTIIVADGLGHGPLAADAAHAALRIFQQGAAQAPTEIMTAVHSALRATRGAAAAIADIDQSRQIVRFCGVGNIAGTLLTTTGSRSMVSHNGIVGHEARRIREFTYLWSADTLLVLHSDGLASRWTFDQYPGLAVRPSSLIAGVLYRDFVRGRDDATVVVAKQ
jgi:anti-sigma regulatory factor (Ser/Thr protein kinase)